MKKVSIQVPAPDASSYHRVFAPIDELTKTGGVKLVSRWHCFDSDVAVFQRITSASGIETIKSLKRHGVRTVVDMDDNIFATESSNPAFKVWNGDVRKAFRQMLALADVVACSTPLLRTLALDFNKKAIVVPNGLDLDKQYNLDTLRQVREKAKHKDPRVVIGFSGSESHKSDFSFLRGTFAALYKKYGRDIVFRFSGAKPDFIEQDLGADAYRMIDFQPWVDIMQHPMAMSNLGLDIALAPLEKTEFNRYRSNLKWLEYTACRAAVIVSDLEPYADVAETREAIKLRNRGGDWTAAISALIEYPAARESMVLESLARLPEFALRRTAASYLDLIHSTPERKSYSLPSQPETPAAKVDILVPVFNALEDLKLCIGSVQKAIDLTQDEIRLVVVDDASTDPAVFDYLEGLGQQGISVFRNPQNLGFVQTCNRFADLLSRTDADIILLNSDTRVAAGFVHQLQKAAYSNAEIGTVTAVSDHGSIATLPPCEDILEVLARKHFDPVVTPTAVGHCVYVKRAVLDKHVLFSPDFGKGYGEENDLSMRIRGEFYSVIDPNCFVWHKNHASFVKPDNQLQKVLAKHPSYLFEINNFLHTDPLRPVRRHLVANSRDKRPRLLNISHSYAKLAGTEKHILDLSRGLQKNYRVLTAAPEPAAQALQLFYDDQLLSSQMYLHPGHPIAGSSMPFCEEAWNSIIEAFQPDLIHVHHLLNHPLGLLDILTRLGKPVYVSLHDSYFLCPDWTLVGCPGVHSCDTCFQKHFNTTESPAYQKLRRDILHHGLQKAAAIVAPSVYMAEKFREVYPDLSVRVIPHGIEPAVSTRQPRSEGPLRFGFLGNFTSQKGSDLLCRAWTEFLRKVGPGRAELHVFGASDTARKNSEDGSLLFHGLYHPSELPGILSRIDIGVVPSVMAEPYCYTVDELLGAGVPVLAANHGAPAERIEAGSTGWFFEPSSVESLCQAMVDLLLVFEAGKAFGNIPSNFRTLEDMARDYCHIYSSD